MKYLLVAIILACGRCSRLYTADEDIIIPASGAKGKDRTLTLRIHMRDDPASNSHENSMSPVHDVYRRARESAADDDRGNLFKREVPCDDVECHNGVCMQSRNDYEPKCECYEGFSGKRCDQIRLECNENKWKCQGGKCENHHGTHMCRCDNGLVGLNCKDNVITNPCSGQSRISQVHTMRGFGSTMPHLFAHCVANDTFIARRCPRNLFWDQQAETCVREQPAAPTGMCASFPCANGGQCIDEANDYSCVCTPGYAGKDCTQRIDMCINNPCQGGKCRSWSGGYTCECPGKVYDQCCCNGVVNRCSRGVDFYPHNATSFVHCGPSGEAYLKSCPPGLLWQNDVKTCVRPTSYAHYTNTWDYNYKRSYKGKKKLSPPEPYEPVPSHFTPASQQSEEVNIEIPRSGKDFRVDIPLGDAEDRLVQENQRRNNVDKIPPPSRASFLSREGGVLSSPSFDGRHEEASPLAKVSRDKEQEWIESNHNWMKSNNAFDDKSMAGAEVNLKADDPSRDTEGMKPVQLNAQQNNLRWHGDAVPPVLPQGYGSMSQFPSFTEGRQHGNNLIRVAENHPVVPSIRADINGAASFQGKGTFMDNRDPYLKQKETEILEDQSSQLALKDSRIPDMLAHERHAYGRAAMPQQSEWAPQSSGRQDHTNVLSNDFYRSQFKYPTNANRMSEEKEPNSVVNEAHGYSKWRVDNVVDPGRLKQNERSVAPNAISHVNDEYGRMASSNQGADRNSHMADGFNYASSPYMRSHTTYPTRHRLPLNIEGEQTGVDAQSPEAGQQTQVASQYPSGLNERNLLTAYRQEANESPNAAGPSGVTNEPQWVPVHQGTMQRGQPEKDQLQPNVNLHLQEQRSEWSTVQGRDNPDIYSPNQLLTVNGASKNDADSEWKAAVDTPRAIFRRYAGDDVMPAEEGFKSVQIAQAPTSYSTNRNTIPVKFLEYHY